MPADTPSPDPGETPEDACGSTGAMTGRAGPASPDHASPLVGALARVRV